MNVWEIPEPHETAAVRVAEHTTITLRRHGNPDGRRLLLSHGNGLAIDLYYPFWSLLSDDFDLVVHDLRNHGWNDPGPLRDHAVPAFARDHDRIVDAIDAHFGRRPTVGVYHSVSSLGVLLSPARGSHYSGLVLFDPPLCKPGRSHGEFEAAAQRTAKSTRRRTPRFDSLEEFAELLQFMPTFRQAVPGVLDLVARTTLRECVGGDGYELRCPPGHEAQIIDYAHVFATSVALEEIRCPVKVIGADPTLPYSYLPTFDLSDMLSVDYDFLPESTHFLQLERPEECAALMREFLDRITWQGTSN